MATYTYTVDINGFLSDVQNITVTKGRVQVQDPFKAGTATITGRKPDDLPTIDIGDSVFILANDGTTTYDIFQGVVADLKVTYGQVSSMDTWQIDCEDVLARVGRALTTSDFNWLAGITTGNAISQTVSNATGSAVSVFVDPLFPGASTVSAQSVYNQNALQVINQLIQTEQGWLRAADVNTVGFVARNEASAFNTEGDFTDGTLSTANPSGPYDQILFRSQADSFYDEVVVEPVGLASQSAGSGARRYSLNSYNQTTSQAGDLAAYVLATLQVQNSVPSVLSAISQVQTNNMAMRTFEGAASGAQIGLILRGQKYFLFVEGATLTATPEQTRWSYNLVSSEALNFFILDSASFGVLDQNKLGF